MSKKNKKDGNILSFFQKGIKKKDSDDSNPKPMATSETSTILSNVSTFLLIFKE